MERDEKRDYLVSLRESTGMTRRDFAIEYNIPLQDICFRNILRLFHVLRMIIIRNVIIGRIVKKEEHEQFQK